MLIHVLYDTVTMVYDYYDWGYTCFVNLVMIIVYWLFLSF
jgi:hypothetical protein